MNKKINTFYKILIIFLVVSSCFLYYRTRLEQLISPNEYIRSCTDFGQYFLEVQEYVRWENIIDLMKVAEEPGIFLILSSFVRITNIPEKSVLPIFSMIAYCMMWLILSIIASKIFFKSQGKYKLWFLVVLVYISLYWNINSQVAGIWRQVLGEIYILLLIMTSFYWNNRKIRLIMILFVWMSFLSHTFSTITVVGTYMLLIGYDFSLKIDRKKKLKEHISVFLGGLLITLPYLYYVFFGYIYDYAVYLFRYIFGLSVLSAGEFNSGDGYFWYSGVKNTGFNFFWPDPDHILPILFYFLNYSYIIIIMVANLKIINFITKKSIYKVFFIILTLYVSMRIDFSTRALLSFELIIIPIISVLIFNFNKGRIFNLMSIVGIFYLGFLWVLNWIINKNFSTNIANDASVSFIKNNFSHKDNIYFMGGMCSSDIMAQLNINNAFNYHLNLRNARQDKAEGKLDFTRTLRVTGNNILFLGRSPVLFDLFQGKEIYIVFTKSDWRILPELNQWKHALFNKSYIELIYSNTDKAALVRYIFHIKNDAIIYSDTPNYISNNLKLEDDLNE